MPQHKHRLKIDTALERAYKALDTVLEYKPETFAEINSLKAVDLSEVKRTRDNIRKAFINALSLKP